MDREATKTVLTKGTADEPREECCALYYAERTEFYEVSAAQEHNRRRRGNEDRNRVLDY